MVSQHTPNTDGAERKGHSEERGRTLAFALSASRADVSVLAAFLASDPPSCEWVKMHASGNAWYGSKSAAFCILLVQKEFYGAKHGIARCILDLLGTWDDKVPSRRWEKNWRETRVFLILHLVTLVALVASEQTHRRTNPLFVSAWPTRTWRCIALSRGFCYVGLQFLVLASLLFDSPFRFRWQSQGASFSGLFFFFFWFCVFDQSGIWERE
jgi:hypothetical protein